MGIEGKKLPRVKPGEPYSASMHNKLVDAIEASSRVALGPGMMGVSGPGGLAISYEPPPRITMLLISNTLTKYSWKEQWFDGTNWHDTGVAGSSTIDPAYNINTNSPTLPYRVFAWRAPSTGVWLFSYC